MPSQKPRSLTPVPKASLSEQVTAQLRRAILSGDIAVGVRLHEVELADTLGVSRGPVRDAIVALRQEGLLESAWHRGAHVRRMTTDDAREIYSLRGVIEALAAREAIRRMTPEDERLMTAAAEAIEEAAREGDPGRLLDADLAFHDSLYHAAHHERLLDTWTSIRAQMALLLLERTRDEVGYRGQVPQEHREILEAVLDRDEALAQQLVGRHIDEARERAERGLAGREQTG